VGDDENKRQQYIQEYHEHEGIQLECDKIEHKKGLCALAKTIIIIMIIMIYIALFLQGIFKIK